MPRCWLILPLIAALAGCPSTKGSSEPDSGSTPANHQARGPRIRLGTASIAFGQVPLFSGETVTTVRKLVVFNEGDSELAIQKVELSAPDAELEVGTPAGWEPGDSLGARAGSNAIEFELRLTPKALGKKSWELIVSSNDPTAAQLRISISAEVIPSLPCNFTMTPRVSLPQVAPPEIREVPVQIHNEGTAAVEQCLLKNLRLEGGDASFISLPDGGIDQRLLRANETLEVPVRIVSSPGISPTDVHAELRFGISSPTEPEVTVPISAHLVGQSCLVVAPDDLDFGTVAITCSSTQRAFEVYNLCASDVVVRSFSMAAAGGQPAGGPNCPGTVSCPEFSLVQTPPLPTSGRVLKTGEHLSFVAVYRPIDNGSDTGAVAIDAGGVTYVVPFHGKGDNTAIQTDVYTMDPRPKSDVLLVIDNSTAMAPYQTSLATNLQAFLRYSKAAKTDFHLAVITSEPGAGGHFLSGPTDPDAVLNPDSVDLDTQFAAKVDVGATSTAAPECMQQALEALTDPANAAQATDFLRDEAALAVICITASTDHSPQTVAQYLNAYWDIRGQNRKTMFTFDAVGGFSLSCPGDSGRLLSAVDQTNGTRDDICTPDWVKALEQLGKVAFGFRVQYYLTSVPNLVSGPIEVRIDGTLIDSVDPKGARVWTFDPVANSIKFEPLYAPEPGQTLEITYFASVCLGY